MHFVTGGAFNGKSKWVREQYQLEDLEHTWISAYKGEKIPDLNSKKIIVLEGIEVWIREVTRSISADSSREKWQSLIQEWMKWESMDDKRKLILIGNDISKGIVPIAPEERLWRDATGWVYQDLVSDAERVDVIWYGISQKLK
ncbi:bifunctional adenosylcobinamide kinase/adenosylcobinamide-phosphate guanylyltransferase [Mesobacillus sp. AQ2]|uniref:bifunctional adenosylcobinamide kinase/adenosylcobinamide-phosphate guanylyltransferase n=1 Tax=Mesobacillus sp. AQ2 TaxID=3043332 RepID=UPI0024C200A4|nr:bifunctional adenosylcobinamide kinase/adenosylcobinamide-phosphate guanylyltransferase [Mesobacillus sp. AQ2]WHX42702.1 bifunctional adenosylcobinamide kinase/adenosylcobinamide-phosphate guanylyltransferase [Mesobacillus sp. AQ2]